MFSDAKNFFLDIVTKQFILSDRKFFFWAQECFFLQYGEISCCYEKNLAARTEIFCYQENIFLAP